MAAKSATRLRTVPHTSDMRTTHPLRVGSSTLDRINCTRVSGVRGAPCSHRGHTNGNPRCSANTVSVVPSKYLEVAHKLADAAGDITSRYFRTKLNIENKGDESPVTVADRAAEIEMRYIINNAFPEHGVFGEEEGLDLRKGEYVWILDPIDGTRSFITGKPLYGTLIGLVKNGVPILGIIDQAILKERWVGVNGQPTTLNGETIHTRVCGRLDEAYMYSTTPLMFDEASVEGYAALMKQVKEPMYGCDCYAYGLLAAGHCDLVVEADLKPYDFMALIPVIEGAGGLVTNWKGERLGFDPKHLTDGSGDVLATEIIAACDENTHRNALRVIKAGLPAEELAALKSAMSSMHG